MFIGVVLYAPDGVVGWVKLHRRRRCVAAVAARAFLRLVAPAFAAACVGTIMLIELANRSFSWCKAKVDDPSVRRQPRRSDRAAWIAAIVLFGAGVVAVRCCGREWATPGRCERALHSREPA